MYPEIHLPFDLPLIDTIKAYGVFVMLGFLTGVWMAMRRGVRVKADPDVVLNLGLISLIFGVLGARIFFVVHYWETMFADAPNPLLAIIDIREGGLEFLGGPIGACIGCLLYLKFTRRSARMYLDILAPSLMWGLAFGRIGCFFNGCCFGAPCVEPVANKPALPWAVEFPYGSPAQYREWERRQVTLPAEFIISGPNVYSPEPISAHALNLPVEKRLRPQERYRTATEQLEAAKEAGASEQELQPLRAEVQAARIALNQFRRSESVAFVEEYSQPFPSRDDPSRPTSFSELEHLASRHTSLPVHPTQLYSSVHALALSLFLSAVFYLRKRHGMAFGLMLVTYPIGRFLLEIIRNDNPHDAAGLTISQFVSIGVFLGGLIYLYVLYFRMPARSPLAVPWVPPESDASGKASAGG